MGLDVRLIARLARRPVYLKILRLLKEPKYTRELLEYLPEWRRTHRRLKELEAMGLIRRWRGERGRVYQGLTEKGKRILELWEGSEWRSARPSHAICEFHTRTGQQGG